MLMERWKKIHYHDKIYTTSFVFFLLSVIPMILTGNNPIITLSQYHQFVLYYFVFICWWICGIFGIYGYIKQFNFELDDDKPQTVTGSKITKRKHYRLEISHLLSRSDHLDKVRSNLRNGIAIILGIGTSILIYVASLPVSTVYEKEYLILSAGLLVFLTVLGILFSFSNPGNLIGTAGFGEGLVPLDMTEEEYQTDLELIIRIKEDILSRMRSYVGIGLVLFISTAAVSFFNPILLEDIPVEFLGYERIFASILQSSSLVLLLVFLALLMMTIMGKYVLGIFGDNNDSDK